jgi:hypothetical protein
VHNKFLKDFYKIEKYYPRTLMNFGNASYMFDDDESPSFFITLDTNHGQKTMWSLGFKDALNSSNCSPGDTISIKGAGKTPVTLESGKKAYRNSYLITKINPTLSARASKTNHTTTSRDEKLAAKQRDNAHNSIHNPYKTTSTFSIFKYILAALVLILLYHS